MALSREYTAGIYTARLRELGTARFQVAGSWHDREQTIVASEILPPDAQPMRIERHLVERGGRYPSTDVQVNGISLKLTERNQLASWIAANGGQIGTPLALLRQQIAGL